MLLQGESYYNSDQTVQMTRSQLVPDDGNKLIYWPCHAKNSEYGQEIPQSQTADNPVASRGRAAQPSRDTRMTN